MKAEQKKTRRVSRVMDRRRRLTRQGKVVGGHEDLVGGIIALGVERFWLHSLEVDSCVGFVLFIGEMEMV